MQGMGTFSLWSCRSSSIGLVLDCGGARNPYAVRKHRVHHRPTKRRQWRRRRDSHYRTATLSPIMPLGGGRHITARSTSLKLVCFTSLATASLVVVRWSTPHRGPLATGDMRHGNYYLPPMLTKPPKSSAHSCMPAPFVLLATTTASRAS